MTHLKLKVPPIFQAFTSILTIWLFSQYLPVISFEIIYRPVITAIITIIGSLIAIAGVVSFRTVKTTISPRTPDKASKLVITGIYNYTRNPMYLGLLVILFGLAIFSGAMSSFLVMPVFVWFMNRLQIEPEEEALEGLFGKSYREYKLRVGRWL